MSVQVYIKYVFILVFVAGLVFNPFLQNTLGTSIKGFDYLIWMFFFANLIIIRGLVKEFRIPYVYLLLCSLIVVFISFNYFFSQYIHSLNSYLIGTFVSLIFPLTFVSAYSTKIDKEHIFDLLKTLFFAINLIVFISVIERIFWYFGFGNIPFLNILKTRGFAGTLASINIALALFLYYYYRKKRYLVLMTFSLFAIGLFVFFKSFASAMIVLFLYHSLIKKKHPVKMFLLFGFIFILVGVAIAITPAISRKFYNYQIYYLQSSGDNLTPRLLLYSEAVNIAKDHFPFGSGQGTYGSFPVMMHYSNVYHDYNLSNKQGLRFNDSQNFLFDSHWASILGEKGFIGGLIYFLMFLYPVFFARKHTKLERNRPISFLIIAFVSIILVESFALAIPYQISFILIYAGLTGFLCRFLNDNQMPERKSTLQEN